MIALRSTIRRLKFQMFLLSMPKAMDGRTSLVNRVSVSDWREVVG